MKNLNTAISSFATCVPAGGGLSLLPEVCRLPPQAYSMDRYSSCSDSLSRMEPCQTGPVGIERLLGSKESFKTPGAVDTLILRLGHLDDKVRDASKRVLIARGEDAVDPLLRALDIRIQPLLSDVIKILGTIGDPRAVKPLIETARREGRELYPEEYLPTQSKDIATARYNERWRRIRECGEALLRIGESAVEPLIEALRRSGGDVDHVFVSVLLQLKDPRTIVPVVHTLSDRSYVKHLIEEARKTFIALGPLAVEPLIQALDLGSENARAFAASVLGSIGDRRAVMPLIRALDDEFDRVQESAASALGLIGDRRAVMPIIRVLDDRFGRVRESVVSALGSIGDRRAVVPLIARLVSVRDRTVSVPTAKALGKIGDARAIKPIMRIFREGSGDWRQQRDIENVLRELESANQQKKKSSKKPRT